MQADIDVMRLQVTERGARADQPHETAILGEGPDHQLSGIEHAAGQNPIHPEDQTLAIRAVAVQRHRDVEIAAGGQIRHGGTIDDRSQTLAVEIEAGIIMGGGIRHMRADRGMAGGCRHESAVPGERQDRLGGKLQLWVDNSLSGEADFAGSLKDGAGQDLNFGTVHPEHDFDGTLTAFDVTVTETAWTSPSSTIL